MSSAAIDVVGIGNAIVDVIAHADEGFIAGQGFAKGSMNLIDAARADSLYAAMGPAIESSGGSAGNPMAGIASLGRRAACRGLVRGEVDILFANEAEICSLYETDDFKEAANAVREHVAIAALTRSERGSVVLANGEEHAVAAVPVPRVVDTTGAGDLYAAGFLFGLTHGLPLPTCGKIGSLCAAEIISHVGARPEVALKGLVEAARLV